MSPFAVYLWHNTLKLTICSRRSQVVNQYSAATVPVSTLNLLLLLLALNVKNFYVKHITWGMN